MAPLDAIAALGTELSLPPPERASAPRGVYVLVSDGQAVYIGATSNIQNRLAHHFYGLGHGAPKTFDRAIWIPLPHTDVPAYEGALIRALRPPLNRRAPAPCGRDIEILSRLGLPPHDEHAIQAEINRDHYTPRPPPPPRARRARS